MYTAFVTVHTVCLWQNSSLLYRKKKKPTFLPSFPKTGHKAYGIEYSCKGLDNFKTISPFQEENSWEFSLSI